MTWEMSLDSTTDTGFRSEMDKAIREAFEPAGLTPTEQQIKQLVDYAECLVETNRVMNLTAITDPAGIAQLHYVDSLMLLPHLPPAGLLVDVGTGAGLPGIPLKIMRPDLEVVLVDSLAKRVRFLKNTIERLGLSTVTCLHARAEEAGRDQNLRGKAAVVTARAVAALPVLAEYCLPLLAVGGSFLAMKGRLTQTEAKAGQRAARKLGGRVIESLSYVLPASDVARTLVIIKQEKNSPKTYPRKPGTPAKHPL